MLARKDSGHSSFALLKTLVHFKYIKQATYRGERLGERCTLFMIALMVESGKSNDLVKMEVILGLLGFSKANISLDVLTSPLLRLGLIARPSWGLFTLTNEGEYFLRDLETLFSRITQNTIRSKFRKIDPNDPLRAKYIRGKRERGAKVVTVPIDDRLKLRHGLVPLRKNGKPRQINLPDSNSI